MSRELTISISVALASGAGCILFWLWSSGQPWWKKQTMETRLRWVLTAQLVLLGASVLLAAFWWGNILLVALLFGAVKVTERELQLEIRTRRLGLTLDALERSGEIDTETLQELRKTLDIINRIGT